MKWHITLVLTVLIALVSYGLYQLSYEVQKLGADLNRLHTGIENNKETIQVLKAEWAYENRPEVLQALAVKHLPLLLLAPYQVVEIAELPSRATNAFAALEQAVPTPRSKPRRKKGFVISPPEGPLHMAAYAKGSQGRRGAE